MCSYKQNPKRGIDWTIIIVTAVLLLFGLVSLLNVLSDPFDGTETNIQSFMARLNFDLFNRQAGNILIGLLLAIPVAITDYRKYKPLLFPLFCLFCFLLVVLLAFGKTTRGIQGWFTVESGNISRSFQPSELSKVILIGMLSKAASDAYDKKGHLRSFRDVFICALIFVIPFVLVLLQPDFGTAMVLLTIFIAVMFSARVGYIYIIGAAAASAVGLPLIYKFLLSYDQKQRIRVFLDPTLDPQGNGYNVLRAKELIGFGGIWGKGYFTEGTLSQTGYVPERQTDFIFSSIGEGLGFAGGAVLIALYILLVVRCLKIAFKARDTFGRCMCIGTASMIFIHVFENIGMNLGLMPVTGIPLPLISYGGSNIMATLLSLAIVLSVNYRTVNAGQIK